MGPPRPCCHLGRDAGRAYGWRGHTCNRFIEDLVRPHVLPKELEDAYTAMARGESNEAEALEWGEGCSSLG
jgi:hypothetical protein